MSSLRWPVAENREVEIFISAIPGDMPRLGLRFVNFSSDRFGDVLEGLREAGFEKRDHVFLRNRRFSQFSMNELRDLVPGVEFESVEQERGRILVTNASLFAESIAQKAAAARFAAREKPEIISLLTGMLEAPDLAAASGVRLEDFLQDADVKEAVGRYEAVRRQGLNALSDYDVVIAYSQDVRAATLMTMRLASGRLTAVLKTAQERRVESVVEEPASRESVAEEPEPSSARKRGARTTIEDAGEKIGGARKDFYSKSIDNRVESIHDMTDEERVSLKKADFWPGIDLAALKEQGVDPLVAYAMREARRMVPDSPPTARSATSYGRYCTALARHFATVRSLDDFREALIAASVESGLYEIERDERNGAVRICRRATDGVAIFNDYLNQRNGRRKGSAAIRALDRIRPMNAASFAYFVESKNWRFGQYRRDQPQTWPATWDRIMQERQSVAARRSRSVADEEGESGDAFTRPHLEHLERSDFLPDLRNGANVGAEDFLETFGFRAVEFGNSLPQDERQAVLNMAYDAFSTLADVMQVPPESMGLGGRLALAFGARGRGGKRAALAHYEPGRTVMNLTRIKGAGSLAHEYAHALDHWLADQARKHPDCPGPMKVVSLQTMMASQWSDRFKGAAFPPALAGAESASSLGASLRLRKATKEEVVENCRVLAENRMSNAQTWIQHILTAILKQDAASALADAGKLLSAQDCKMFDAIVSDARERLKSDVVMPEAHKKRYRDAIKTTVERWGACAEAVEEYSRVRQAGSYIPQMSKRLNFFNDAQTLDKARSKNYWSTPHEMTARAFECWVFDNLAARGARDDYLVHGVEADRYAEVASPYPKPGERSEVGELVARFVRSASNCMQDSCVAEDVARERSVA